MLTSPHDQWIRSLLPVAQRWEDKTGIPASTWLAMAISESNWGAAGNALFGIKGSGTAGSLNSPTWESENGQAVNTTADFAQFNNPDEAFQAFWNLVTTSPRYADAVKLLPDNPQGFLQAINQDGYATDPQWSDKIQSIANTTVEPMIARLGANSGGRYMGQNQEGGIPPGPAGGIGPLTTQELAEAMGSSYVDPTGGLSPDTAASPQNPSGAAAGPGTQNPPITPGNYSQAAWLQEIANRQGIASISPSKSIMTPDPNDITGHAKISTPDPNAPSIIAFNDGSIAIAHLYGNDKQNPNSVQVVSSPTVSKGQRLLASGPNDKYILVFNPETGEYTATQNPNYLVPSRTLAGGASPSDQWITTIDPATGKITKETNPNYVPPKPQIVQQPNGAILSFNPEAGTITQLQGPDATETAIKQAQLAQAQKNLLPEQQKLFQDANDSIDAISQAWATGKITTAERDSYINEIHSGLQASLAGTTLFQQQQEQNRLRQQAADQARTTLAQRVSDITGMAHSLLTAAAGNVFMPAGKTSLGIDPFSIAKSEVDSLSGGQALANQAISALSSFLTNPNAPLTSEASSATPAATFTGVVPSGQETGSLPPSAPFSALQNTSTSPTTSRLLSTLSQAGIGAPEQNAQPLHGVYPAGGTITVAPPIPPPIETPTPFQAPPSLEGPSTNLNQAALSPQGPSVLNMLAQALMAGAH